MSKVIDANGNAIGSFDGTSVKNKNGLVLYWISDGEVYQPIEYIEKDLQHMNKGQTLCVGNFFNKNAVTNKGKLLFKVL